MAGTKGRSGGKRVGAGKKPKPPAEYSDATKTRWMEALEYFAKKQGVTFETYMVMMIADPDVADSTKSSILKVIQDVLVVKETHSKQEKHITEHKAPLIGLPPVKGEDPALKVVGGSDS